MRGLLDAADVERIRGAFRAPTVLAATYQTSLEGYARAANGRSLRSIARRTWTAVDVDAMESSPFFFDALCDLAVRTALTP